jgi:hypothetical protein
MTKTEPIRNDEAGNDGTEQMKKLLQAAMPRTAEDAEPARDLWPGVLNRMAGEPARVPWAGVPWFDWALAAGLVALAAALPNAIPVFLYYL